MGRKRWIFHAAVFTCHGGVCKDIENKIGTELRNKNASTIGGCISKENLLRFTVSEKSGFKLPLVLSRGIVLSKMKPA